jgi:hypothetical protein
MPRKEESCTRSADCPGKYVCNLTTNQCQAPFPWVAFAGMCCLLLLCCLLVSKSNKGGGSGDDVLALFVCCDLLNF